MMRFIASIENHSFLSPAYVRERKRKRGNGVAAGNCLG
jgi:hypothetical protein